VNAAHKQLLSADQRRRNEVEGAVSSISMAFLVICAEKIRMLLRIFFLPIFAWVYAWQWPGCLWMALMDIGLLEDNRIR
jgi:hypothetical protein